MATITATAGKKPRILITAQDLETLEALVGHSASKTGGSALLEEELARAVVVKGASDARPFCRIGSWVSYEDLGSGQVREIQVVLPPEADIDRGRVSVLSLVGASLLGLAPGAEFGWADDGGRPHRLKVLRMGVEPHADSK